MQNSMKVVFTGGGTLGPVTPLLAVAQAWKARREDIEFVWIGTPHGPERVLVEDEHIRFFELPVARLPRYISFEWITLPWQMLRATHKAKKILKKIQPDLVGSAGGYTAVPVIFAAKMLGIPVWVHQQDVETILTNKITAPFANVLTMAWEQNRAHLPSKAVLVGNPARSQIRSGSAIRAIEQLNLNPKKPTILVTGGGSGAKWINETMAKIAHEVAVEANVIHLTGRGKMLESLKGIDDYHAREFASERMRDYMAIADVVISRAGLGTITELSALSKASIIIPLPNSPQIANTQALGESVVRVDEADTEASVLLGHVSNLLQDKKKREELGASLHALLQTDCVGAMIDLLEKKTHP